MSRLSALGIPAAIVISAGFKEFGEHGKELERQISEIIRGREIAAPANSSASAPKTGGADRRLRGEGSASVSAAPDKVWAMLLDPATLKAAIPGCRHVERIDDSRFRADVTIGIGPVKGRYRAEVTLSEPDPPRAPEPVPALPRVPEPVRDAVLPRLPLRVRDPWLLSSSDAGTPKAARSGSH